MLASWLMHYNDTCPDPALIAYDNLGEAEQTAPRFLIWIAVFLAIEQIVHAITLAFENRRLIFGVKTQPFRLPTGLALLWVVFTAMSIVLVALTFRSNAAVLAKTIHVVIEGLFLIFLCVAFGLRVIGAIAGFFLLVGILMVLSLPCSETILYAASSGLVLDAINFLAYAWYGLTRPNDQLLWLLIWGLGWHAMYLLTMLGVMRWYQLSGGAKIAWRIFGVYFNIIASELFLAAVRREFRVTDGGIVNLKEWLSRYDDDELSTPLCLWTTDGLRLLGPLSKENELKLVNPYRPGRTAYTRRAIRQTILGIFPIFTNQVRYTRVGSTTRMEYAFLCAYGWFRPIEVDHVNEASTTTGFVLSWGMIRTVYWAFVIAYALIAASFP